MRMKAFNLARIDKEYDIAMQAWMNHQATATKSTGSGKNAKTVSVYDSFKDFFDYEKKLKEVEEPETRGLSDIEKRMARAAAILNAKGG